MSMKLLDMTVQARTWQWVQVGAGAILLVVSAVMSNVVLGTAAVAGLGFGLVALRSPTLEQRIEKVKKLGIYPAEGKAKDKDVERIAKAGHEIVAINLYREIHDASLKDASAAVKAMIEGKK